MVKRINAIKRNEEGLHCRFCEDNFNNVLLYETLGIKGIVCYNCLGHLSSYVHVKIIK